MYKVTLPFAGNATFLMKNLPNFKRNLHESTRTSKKIKTLLRINKRVIVMNVKMTARNASKTFISASRMNVEKNINKIMLNMPVPKLPRQM